MKLVVDANIPLALEAFSQFGTVVKKAGRDLIKDDLADADALIVRSVTNVNSALLEGTPVRFVGTATIGTDHLDIPWLEANGIRWASAQGCNARSVVEWVLAATLEWCVSDQGDVQVPVSELKMGIIGHGNIGSRLAVKARALGMSVLISDPPVAERDPYFINTPLEEILATCDVITLHVPMVKSGPHPTVRMISIDQLRQLKRGALMLNASRGSVVDNPAALEMLATGNFELGLDVFEGEPRPNRDLVRRCRLVTPHIAGYSHEGKVNGTRMIAEAVAAWLGRESSWQPELPSPPEKRFMALGSSREEILRTAIRHSYDIRVDDANMRAGLAAPNDQDWGNHFDALRKNYPQRREFAGYEVIPAAVPGAVEMLRAAGFQVVAP